MTDETKKKIEIIKERVGTGPYERVWVSCDSESCGSDWCRGGHWLSRRKKDAKDQVGAPERSDIL